MICFGCTDNSGMASTPHIDYFLNTINASDVTITVTLLNKKN